MNILFLFENTIIPHIGGVQRVTHVLTQELLRRGHSVAFLSTVESPVEYSYEYIAKQYYINFKKEKESIEEEYHRILKEENIEIVINQEPRSDTHYLLSLTPKGIKKITCLHTQPFNTQSYAKLMLGYNKCHNWKSFLYVNFCRFFPIYYLKQTRIIERTRLYKSLEVSDFLCFLSKRFIPRVLKFMPNVDEKKLLAINNPVTFECLETSKCIKEKTIIWVGRQENYNKNIPAFIDIWEIISKNNKDWKAIIIGDGADKQYNIDYAKSKDVKRLEFAGIQENVIPFYQKASFIGVTSICEGWGMTLTEAMSYGCVPFAYNTYESICDIIDDNIDGIIVRPFDKKEMARRIQELIDDSEKYITMQKEAIKKVKNFSVENIVNQWEQVFDK